MKKKPSDLRFAFFGTPEISVTVANELEKAGYLPAVVITRMDAPVGRGKVLTPPPMKVWAEARGIDVLQPKKITEDVVASLQNTEWDLFIVAAYGRLLPQSLLDIPKKGTLNVHPSLLPKLRGPSPIRSAILTDEKETGVSIMVLDVDMDHGPLLGQTTVQLDEWPPHALELESILATEGGRLLAEILPQWLEGTLTAVEQDHTQATFCKMLKKEQGLLNLADDAYANLLRIRAFEGWPGTYTFFERRGTRMRVQILDAHMEGKTLAIDTVKPEGKNAMNYADFLRSGAVPAQDLTQDTI